MRKGIALLFVFLLFLVNGVFAYAGNIESKYPLQGVVVLGRHNLRAPLHTEELDALTTHRWRKWEANGELTPKGHELETLMGCYFRAWLEREGLFPRLYVPAGGEVRLYANSAQRTVATAKSFGAGLLPVAPLEVEYLDPVGKTDPVFRFKVPEDPTLRKAAQREFAAAGGEESILKSVEEPLRVVAEALDFPNSPYAKTHGVKKFDATSYKIYTGEKFALKASFQPAKDAADGLVLAYYEGDGAFGKKLTEEEWRKIAAVNEAGISAIFKMPGLSKAVARRTIKELEAELTKEGRKFSFLCGHDTNIAAVLSALEVEDYTLPNAIEIKIPIGSKFLMEKRRGKDGKTYVALSLVYAAAEDIVERRELSLKHPPQKVPLHFKNLRENVDGLVLLEDFLTKLKGIANGK